MPKLHDEVFKFLEEYRQIHKDFVYWLRERNTRNRLTDGFWFQGNQDYAFVGLYNRGGGSNMTRSIGLVFEKREEEIHFHFEVVFNEEKDAKVLQLYDDIMKLLGGFDKVSETRFQKKLSDTNGFEVAKKFLDQYKGQLDQLVTKYGLNNLFISPESFKEKLNRILPIKNKILSTMIPAYKIPELKKRWIDFQTDPFFQHRKQQLQFVPWAKRIIEETLNQPLTNELLTGVLQITNHRSGAENVKKYIERNIPDLKLQQMLFEEYTAMGLKGFTTSSKGSIYGLTHGHLQLIQSFLQDAAQVKSIEDAISIVENFDSLNIPHVKAGIYSPWLYYLNPTIFPIKNNSHDGFIEWCEQPSDSYPVAIKLFHEAGEILGEKDLGLLDAFTHLFSTDTEEAIEKENKISKMNLNTILYGPPGTGKTYNTINKAIEIINPEFFDSNPSREEVRDEYERLRKEQQIEFITFHQSMSYEDFIEGIKPKKPEPNDTYVKYIVEEGLFKKIARRADYQPTAQATTFSLNEDEFSKASFYKISLGNTAIADDEQIYRYCIDKGYIALGWGGDIDFTGKSEHEIQQMVPAELEKFAAQSVNYFIHYLKTGDYVVISYGNLRFRAIGKVAGEYEYKNVDGLEVKQFRKVQWLLKEVDIPVEELYNKQFQQQTIYKLNKSEVRREFFVKEQSDKKDHEVKRNYVLIIDEINRGNIAQIFGELITLIETDKRKGNAEALELMLPYSKENFSVPSNLYLIGTMNTADRSIEALDTALRRRFVFEEMQPKPELLSPKTMIARMLNSPASLNFDWVDEPYRAMADGLYELLGTNKSIEERLIKINDETTGIGYWTEQDLEHINDTDFTGVNLQQLLSIINIRIEKLLNRDHTIGHAYLTHVFSLADLQHAFHNKIIPLLQEYFYNDYKKIGWVIGGDFFEQYSDNETGFAKFSFDDEGKEDFEEKIILRLKPYGEWTKETFIKIYNPSYNENE